MRNRSRRQLVLALDQGREPVPMLPKSPELVQALADLLLEALGEAAGEKSNARGGCDESQDHA